MFTGIIEDVGKVKKIQKDQTNILITINCSFTNELQVNQSIAHNGICLSVKSVKRQTYTVCAIKETINKSNIKDLKINDSINLERCMAIGSRMDGHIVQGHVDCTAVCLDIKNFSGSWLFTFKYPQIYQKYLIEKGSISVNGVSLTIAKIKDKSNTFSVAIIPYTFKNTNFHELEIGSKVNLEFDIVSKQINRLINLNSFASVLLKK
ncbi:MAG: riboflavin synthase [Flavobacteriales bacterium]|nr:riboflavin synthase [Flavobacteriales bacterium]|tara:strand:- start:870 stop:1490 length:621 start_codon:yes stop_codon:yes gene_type:complete